MPLLLECVSDLPYRVKCAFGSRFEAGADPETQEASRYPPLRGK